MLESFDLIFLPVMFFFSFFCHSFSLKCKTLKRKCLKAASQCRRYTVDLLRVVVITTSHLIATPETQIWIQGKGIRGDWGDFCKISYKYCI